MANSQAGYAGSAAIGRPLRPAWSMTKRDASTVPRLFLEQVFGPVYFRVLLAGRSYDRTELDVLAATAGRG